jgi:hypothetical protein
VPPDNRLGAELPDGNGVVGPVDRTSGVGGPRVPFVKLTGPADRSDLALEPASALGAVSVRVEHAWRVAGLRYGGSTSSATGNEAGKCVMHGPSMGTELTTTDAGSRLRLVAATPPPEVLTIEEAAAVLRIGRGAAYALARRWRATGGAEGLPVIELGRSLRVPRRELDRLLQASVESPAGSQSA